MKVGVPIKVCESPFTLQKRTGFFFRHATPHLVAFFATLAQRGCSSRVRQAEPWILDLERSWELKRHNTNPWVDIVDVIWISAHNPTPPQQGHSSIPRFPGGCNQWQINCLVLLPRFHEFPQLPLGTSGCSHSTWRSLLGPVSEPKVCHKSFEDKNPQGLWGWGSRGSHQIIHVCAFFPLFQVSPGPPTGLT